MDTDPYRTPLDRYAAPARPRPELWRTLAGLALTAVAGFAIYQALAAIAVGVMGDEASRALFDDLAFAPERPRTALVGLWSFGVFAGGLALALRSLHGRGPTSLLGPDLGRSVRLGLRCAAAVALLLAVTSAILPQDPALVRNDAMPTRLWLALLPLSLAGILIQAGTEELVFRGYLLQQFAARFPGRPVWIGGTAALFALLHFSPASAGQNAAAFAVWAFVFGLAAADLTARSGSLGPAIGMHLSVNVFALLVAGLAGPGAALALWVLPLEPDDPRLAALVLPELLTLFCAWLAARIAIRL